MAPSHTGDVRSALLAVAVALAFADASIVVLALPPIYGEFDTTIVGVSWVVSSYAAVVAVAGVLLAFARRRRSMPALPVLRLGLGLFAVSSIVCGLAPTMGWLITARCAQAIGATALLSGALGAFEATRGEAAGRRVWSFAATTGLAIGPALGGVLTEIFDWRAIFLAQAPVAVLALIATVEGPTASDEDLGATARQEELASPGSVRLADAALVLTSGALVGALFLSVLLVIEVWRYSPIAGAAVVSALPVGLFAARLVGAGGHAPARAAVGCGALAGGLAGLAFLPSASARWAAVALAICGMGFGLVDPVVGAIAERAGADPVRAGARTVAARHAGLLLGLVLIAPALAADLDAGAERAVIAGADTLLDARLRMNEKVEVAQAVADLVERTPRGKMPDVSEAFVDADVSGSEADRAAEDLVTRLEEVLTRSFRRVFLIAAGLALTAVIPAVAAVVLSLRDGSARVPTRPGAPAWVGGIAIVLVVAATAGLLFAESRAGAADMGEVVEEDACTSSPDPYSGDGLDATLQRIALGALNGAACELDVSRERLVLSLADVPGFGSVPLDRDDIEDALEAGLLRAIDDAEDRDSLPGWVASALRFAARNAPIGWIVDGLDLPERLLG